MFEGGKEGTQKRRNDCKKMKSCQKSETKSQKIQKYRHRSAKSIRTEAERRAAIPRTTCASARSRRNWLPAEIH